eukprot:PhM_4_TR17382/c0_g1_i1/m.32905
MSLLWSQVREEIPRKSPATADETAAAHYRGPAVRSQAAFLVGVNEYINDTVAAIPHSVRNCQLMEDRFVRLGFDDVRLMTSATSVQPTTANISSAIRKMKADLYINGSNSNNVGSGGGCELLVIYLSLHTYLANGTLYVVPCDYDPADTSTHLPLEDLVGDDGGGPTLRTVVILDGVHAPGTRRSFPLSRQSSSMSRCNNLPNNVTLLCTAPDFEGSFTLKLLHGLVDLGERQLSLCATSLMKATGPSALMYPLQSTAHTVPIATTAQVSDISDTNVSYLVAMSVAGATSEQGVVHLVSESFPTARVRVLRDAVQPFVIVLSGDEPSLGPVIDYERHGELLDVVCEQLNLPRVTLHKSFHGRLYMSVPESDAQTILNTFHRKMRFGPADDNASPTVHYFGLIYRVELTTTYRHYLLCDALARLHVPEERSRVRLEEVGPCQASSTGAVSSANRGGSVPRHQNDVSANNKHADSSPAPSARKHQAAVVNTRDLEQRVNDVQQRFAQDTAAGRDYGDIEAQVRELQVIVRDMQDRGQQQMASDAQSQQFKRSVQMQLDEMRHRVSQEFESKVGTIGTMMEDHERQISHLTEAISRERAETDSLRRAMKEEQTRVRDELVQLLVRVEKKSADEDGAMLRAEERRLQDERRHADRVAFEEKLNRRATIIEDALKRDVSELTLRLDAVQHDAAAIHQVSAVPQQLTRMQQQITNLEQHLTSVLDMQEQMRVELEVAKKRVASSASSSASPGRGFLTPNGDLTDEARNMIVTIAQQTVSKLVNEENARVASQVVSLQRQLDALTTRVDQELKSGGVGSNIAQQLAHSEESINDVKHQLRELDLKLRERQLSDAQLRAELGSLSPRRSASQQPDENSSGGRLTLKMTELATVLNEMRSQVYQLQSDVQVLQSQQTHHAAQREKDTISLTDFVQTSVNELLAHQNKKIADVEKRTEESLLAAMSSSSLNNNNNNYHHVNNSTSSAAAAAAVEELTTRVDSVAAATNETHRTLKKDVMSRLSELEERLLGVQQLTQNKDRVDSVTAQSLSQRVESVCANTKETQLHIERVLHETMGAMRRELDNLQGTVSELKEHQKNKHNNADDATGGGDVNVLDEIQGEITSLRSKLRSHAGDIESCEKGVKDVKMRIDDLGMDVAKVQGFIEVESDTRARIAELDTRIGEVESSLRRVQKEGRRASMASMRSEAKTSSNV